MSLCQCMANINHLLIALLAASFSAFFFARFSASYLILNSTTSNSADCLIKFVIYVSRFFFSIAMSAILTISIVFRVCSDSKSSSLLFCISSAAICFSCCLMKFSRSSMPPPTYLSKLTKANRYWYMRLSMHTRSDSVRYSLSINCYLWNMKHEFILCAFIALSFASIATSSRIVSSSVSMGSKGCLFWLPDMPETPDMCDSRAEAAIWVIADFAFTNSSYVCILVASF